MFAFDLVSANLASGGCAMLTTLPVKDFRSGELPTVPIPVCMGPPTDLLIATIRTEQDVHDFWNGYAIGGAVCIALLGVELIFILVLL
jgi:hypothetical protein